MYVIKILNTENMSTNNIDRKKYNNNIRTKIFRIFMIKTLWFNLVQIHLSYIFYKEEYFMYIDRIDF